jgi:hypothetical protein
MEGRRKKIICSHVKIFKNNIKHIMFLPLEPTYLAHSPNIPPIVTIHCATGQPISTNTFGIGASGSCIQILLQMLVQDR